MNVPDISQKIVDRDELRRRCDEWRTAGKRIVTTNGAFDILHPGHIHALRMAASFGDILVVGVNDDASIKQYKSPSRPFLPQHHRAYQVAALPWVDAVHVFREPTPDCFIEDAVPHVHCKGDHYTRPLVEEGTTSRVGARIELLPIVDDLSTTSISRKIVNDSLLPLGEDFCQLVEAFTAFCASPSANVFKDAVAQTTLALLNGKKILFCGNGGSAASAQHFAAEFVGRFRRERRALPAMALTVDTSILTSVANDYGYDSVFERQVEALGQAGDILFCLSTSGNSSNCVRAIEAARSKGMVAVSIVGGKKCRMQEVSTYAVVIPSFDTPIVQELTDFLLHRLCGEVDSFVIAH